MPLLPSRFRREGWPVVFFHNGTILKSPPTFRHGFLWRRYIFRTNILVYRFYEFRLQKTGMAQALLLPIFVMDLFDPVNRHWHSILMKVLMCKCLFVEETG